MTLRAFLADRAMRFEIKDRERRDGARAEGKLVGYAGAVWIEGDGWKTRPGWVGWRAVSKAKRYARRNNIKLEVDP